MGGLLGVGGWGGGAKGMLAPSLKLLGKLSGLFLYKMPVSEKGE